MFYTGTKNNPKSGKFYQQETEWEKKVKECAYCYRVNETCECRKFVSLDSRIAFLCEMKGSQGVALENNPDVEELPEAVPHGSFKPVVLPSGQQPTFIMFDLETTDLIRGNMMPHITQIAAFEPFSKSKFNKYVNPKVPISAEASRITGIMKSYSGNITVHGQPVDHSNITEAVNKLILWLRQYQNVFLVAHNGRRFDFQVFITVLEQIGELDKFNNSVIGFIDSIAIFKKVFPNEKSYRQEELVKKYLQAPYAAHDAMEDVITLGHLFFHSNCSADVLMKHSFSTLAIFNQKRFNMEKSKDIDSLTPLVAAGIMKRTTAENIAGSGLNYNHLSVIFQRNGEDGLYNIFTVKNSEGQPRVTNTKRVLDNVIPKLAIFFRNDKS